MSNLEGFNDNDSDKENDFVEDVFGNKKKKKSQDAASKLVSEEIKKRPEEKKDVKVDLFGVKKPEEINVEGKSEEELKQELNPEETRFELLDEENFEQLSEEERSFIISQLREAARGKRADEIEISQEEEEANEALNEFDSKIIDQHIDPDLALKEVLSKRGIDNENVETPKRDFKDPNEIRDMPIENEIWLNNDRVNNTAKSTPFNTDSNVRQTSPNTVLVTTPKVEYLDLRKDELVPTSLDGLSGYLIGRRRGRIDTEKKLIPAKKNLEFKISKLEKQLNANEEYIRRAVREKYKQSVKNTNEAAKLKQKVVAAENEKLNNAANVTNNDKNRNEINGIPLLPNKPIIVGRMVERSPAPEAQHLHVNKKPERIGHLLVYGEAVHKEAPAKKEVRNSVRTEIIEPLNETKIGTMNRVDLLKVSEKITVEGNSLRQIYETHLVGEQGLRRLIAVYNKGGDLQKALKQEVVEREIDFERDPVLRDLTISNTREVGNNADSKTVLNQMINKAEASVAPSNEELAYYKAKAKYHENNLTNQQKKRSVSDVSLLAIIAVLIVIILVLYLSRK